MKKPARRHGTIMQYGTLSSDVMFRLSLSVLFGIALRGPGTTSAGRVLGSSDGDTIGVGHNGGILLGCSQSFSLSCGGDRRGV
jgi:hypothetical protein